MNFSNDALRYESAGLSVIPIQAKGKKPLVKWEKFQKERPTTDQVNEWWQKWPDANIGIVTGDLSNVDVIDIDSGKGFSEVTKLLPEGFKTAEATTPRGGRHLYVSHREGLGNATGFIQDVDYRGQGGYIVAPPSIGENGKPYAWVPGKSLGEVQTEPLPQPIYNSLNKSIYIEGSSPDSNKRLQIVTDSNNLLTQGRRDNDLFHLTNYLVKGGMPQEEIQQYLRVIASKACNPPYPERDISVKIQSAMKRLQRRERNLAEEVREWVLVTDGYFLVTDSYKELQIVTREERNAVKVYLSRLKAEGIIEKYGNKRGQYRKVESECDAIDWQTADDAPFNIQWPLGIEKLATLYPKNIAVIAGTQNAGKSALALNLAYMNRKRHKVRYLSSEMGSQELKTRLKLFPVPLDEWKSLDFRERSSNFSDAILPNDFNIIDFYEISSDFWKISADLKRIYEKLDKGICIVCLQKSQDKAEGRGGDFGLEKPRLYLNLDQNPPDGTIITIRKAKAWARQGHNPNYLKRTFKIVKGCEIVPTDKWHK